MPAGKSDNFFDPATQAMPEMLPTRPMDSPAPPAPRRVPLFILLLASLLPLSSLTAAASEKPLVAAASGMQFALREIVREFTRESSIEIRLTLASSGKLFRQIENNAPFEMFISADSRLVQQLETAGLTRDRSRILARGRLAVIAAAGSPLVVDAELRGLERALAAGQISRFAIANPLHAPYGRRAREALQKSGLWKPLQGRLVVGENVAQATQFALSGAAEGGLVALSLLRGNSHAADLSYALLPEAWHQPLLHSMVLLKRADRTTMRFFDFLQSAKAQRIFERYGYSQGL